MGGLKQGERYVVSFRATQPKFEHKGCYSGLVGGIDEASCAGAAGGLAYSGTAGSVEGCRGVCMKDAGNPSLMGVAGPNEAGA